MSGGEKGKPTRVLPAHEEESSSDTRAWGPAGVCRRDVLGPAREEGVREDIPVTCLQRAREGSIPRQGETLES